MADVLVKGGNLGRDPHTRRTPCEDKAEIYKSRKDGQGTPRSQGSCSEKQQEVWELASVPRRRKEESVGKGMVWVLFRDQVGSRDHVCCGSPGGME